MIDVQAGLTSLGLGRQRCRSGPVLVDWGRMRMIDVQAGLTSLGLGAAGLSRFWSIGRARA